MSYNIDSVDYIGKGRLRIGRKTAKMLMKKYKDDLPESHLLEDLDLDDEDIKEFTLENMWWNGCGSGNSYDTFLEILNHTKGNAKLLLIWEGGDSKTGIEVKDGVTKEKKVKVELE